ncbi:MAG: aromatic ring-hydroxylating dioxygenase subunit alpha [Pseudomonadales bacterium]
MQESTRQKLVGRIKGYLRDQTTAMADCEFRNPVAAYASSERLNQEQRVLFRDYPLLVAMSGQLANPGDYLTEHYCGVPLLLTRQSNGAIAGFVNACSHRGAPVASGTGSVRGHFVCPYHAWSYRLDGSLRSIPDADGFTGLNQQQSGLQTVAVVEKYGMIWAVPNPALAGQPIDIDAHLGDLAPEYASYGFEGYQHFATRELQPKINWKMGIDGFLESYHLRVLHPKTVGPLYFNNLATADSFGLHHRMVAVRKRFAEIDNDAELTADFLKHTNVLYTLFPNTMFVYQIDHLEVWRLFPAADDPNRCTMVLSMYTPEAVTTDSARGHWQKNLDLAIATVEGEDLALGEQIQAGYRSGVQPTVIYGRNEPALAHFHASLEQALKITRSSPPDDPAHENL